MLHTRNTCEIKSLFPHLNDTQIQLKFSKLQFQNVSQNVVFFVLVLAEYFFFVALYFLFWHCEVLQ